MRREGLRLPLQGLVLACLVSLGLASGASAAEIVATIDRPEATVEDQLLLTVVIEGSRGAQPVLPEIPEFDVYPRGQSTQMSFINGRMSSSVTYNYLLVPRTPGVFDIDAVTTEIDGEVLASQPFQVRILEASAQPQQQRDLFITSRVSTTNPFVGQEVTYIWRFYRRVRIGDARLEPQEFQGFLVKCIDLFRGVHHQGNHDTIPCCSRLLIEWIRHGY